MSKPTIIKKGSQLYNDLIDIQDRRKKGEIKLYTHEEVFGKENGKVLEAAKKASRKELNEGEWSSQAEDDSVEHTE